MVVRRGQIWWADLGESRGSSPGYERPVIVVQSNSFNNTKIESIIVAIVTTNLRLADMPGNIRLTKEVSGLDKESVVNITQLFTVDRKDCIQLIGILPNKKIEQINQGLSLVLSLQLK